MYHLRNLIQHSSIHLPLKATTWFLTDNISIIKDPKKLKFVSSLYFFACNFYLFSSILLSLIITWQILSTLSDSFCALSHSLIFQSSSLKLTYIGASELGWDKKTVVWSPKLTKFYISDDLLGSFKYSKKTDLNSITEE